MVSLICLLDNHGTPLLTRHYDNGTEAPSFPTLALLSTVVKYSEHGGYQLDQFASDNMRVVFRSFPEGLLLVAMTGDLATPESALGRMLQRIHDAIVMVLGASTLSGSTDALKRQLKSVVPLVDRLAGRAGAADSGVDMVEILPLSSTERADLRAGASSLAAAAHVDHVAVTLGGRFVAGTPDWWALDPGGVLLIQQLLATQPPALMRDVPLFLPKTSPEVAFRLLTCRLTAEAEVLLLGGPELELTKLAVLAKAAFQATAASLYACATHLPRGCTSSVAFPDEMLIFVCIRSDVQQAFRYCPPLPPEPSATDDQSRAATNLQKFMYHVEALVEQHARDQPPVESGTRTELSDVVLREEDRCYVAVNSGNHTLFAALKEEVPSYAATAIARAALQAVQSLAGYT
ncbi:hypothetical protein KFL_000610340 [Klebsormidium nitens]|uniref:Uncharacterized protein n=1 Tax=Klebsormidium nitens TaxID=105231 RepID=A0A0U9HMS9_KLENI|nr:hypothetical protein KFL_000610340 [Klebsormidium nitens]|eukprot:GAQ80756.1 hypothetical protein KFL_000610340 [Klebsormidium nitens]